MIRLIVKSTTVVAQGEVTAVYKTFDIHNADLQSYFVGDLYGCSEIIGAELVADYNNAGYKINQTEPVYGGGLMGACKDATKIVMEINREKLYSQGGAEISRDAEVPDKAPTKQETIMQLTRKDAETIRLGGVIHDERI